MKHILIAIIICVSVELITYHAFLNSKETVPITFEEKPICTNQDKVGGAGGVYPPNEQ